MKKEETQSPVRSTLLAPYMATVIEQLQRDGKFPAAHGYQCALHSFQNFAGRSDESLPMQEVFTPGRLKAYEEWLLIERKRKLNTVSTYMRTLQAVYNRWSPPGTPEHNPKLFSIVYTQVASQTKRSLSNEQMRKLLMADGYGQTEMLTHQQQVIFAYFLLMFMLRGMPFIDLANLRKCDLQGNILTYRRHKTGKQLTVKLDATALRLIQQYRDRNSDNAYLFPILSADARGGWKQYHYYQDALRRFNRTLQQVMKLLLPGVAVTSYTARHTWATIAYHLKQSVGIISQALGHSSIRVTETYLKPFADARIHEANRQLIAAVRKGR